MNFDIDIAIVSTFLVINLLIGLYYSKNINSVKEYAIGDQNFTTASLTATIVATWVGGNFFAFLVSKSYSDGIYYIIPICIDYAVTFFIIGYFLAPKMKEFLGATSVAEAMGQLYGKNIRIITALSGFLAIGSLIAIQFKISSSLLSNFFNISEFGAIMITSLIVIIYSALGGIKSVTFTDVLQFCTFGITIPVLGFVIWGDIPSIDFVINSMKHNSVYNTSGFHFANPNFVNMIQLSFIFLIPALHPSLFQRIAMNKSTAQIKKSFLLSSFIGLCLVILTCWIGILVYTINPNLEPDTVWIHIINTYTTPGLRGLAIIGIISMIMSTADSYINSSGVLISNDVYSVIFKNTEKHKLLITKISSLVIGVISILLALYSADILSLLLIANNFYIPIVSVPLILAILKFRSSSKAVMIGMTAGFTSVVLWRSFVMPHTNIDSILPGALANFIFFVGSHYLMKQEGGWLKSGTRRSIKKKLDLKKNFKLLNIENFWKKNLPYKNDVYILFGGFLLISTLLSIYSITPFTRISFNILIQWMAFCSTLISTAFLTYPLWIKAFKNKSFLSILWMLSLVFGLVFKPCFEMFLSQFAYFQSIIYLLSIIVLSILVRWHIVLFLISTGTILAVLFANIISLENNIEFKLIYLLFGVTCILIAFFKPKQEYLEATEAKVDTLETEVTNLDHEVINLNGRVTNLNNTVSHYNQRISDQSKEIDRLNETGQRILNNVNHELRLPVGNVMNFAEMLNEGLEKFSPEQIKMISDEVYKNSNRLGSMILNMLDLATLDVKKVNLQKKTVNFSELVENRVKICRSIYLDNKPIDFKLIIDPEILISVDPNYLRQTIDNLVINAINFSKEGTIEVIVKNQPKSVELTIKDEGIGIPKNDIYDIFTPFKMGSNTESKAEGRGVGLALCRSAVEAHEGSIKAESNGKGAKFTVVLPKQK